MQMWKKKLDWKKLMIAKYMTNTNWLWDTRLRLVKKVIKSKPFTIRDLYLILGKNFVAENESINWASVQIQIQYFNWSNQV